MSESAPAFAPTAARFAAARLLEAAATRDPRALERAKDLILCFAKAAGHAAFPEMLIGEIALAGIARNAPRSSSYSEAEAFARCALQRLIPELRISPELQCFTSTDRRG
jgi:hypothetical protein